MADTPAEVEAETLGDTRSDAHALVDTLADSLAEVEAETPFDTRSDTQALLDPVADSLAEGKGRDTSRHTGRFVRTGRHWLTRVRRWSR